MYKSYISLLIYVGVFIKSGPLLASPGCENYPYKHNQICYLFREDHITILSTYQTSIDFEDVGEELDALTESELGAKSNLLLQLETGLPRIVRERQTSIICDVVEEVSNRREHSSYSIKKKIAGISRLSQCVETGRRSMVTVHYKLKKE